MEPTVCAEKNFAFSSTDETSENINLSHRSSSLITWSNGHAAGLMPVVTKLEPGTKFDSPQKYKNQTWKGSDNAYLIRQSFEHLLRQQGPKNKQNAAK